VFILVCKNTKIAKVMYEWLGENKPPFGIPQANIEGFLNTRDRQNTIRVDCKVVHDTDTEGAKGDESLWMRFTLDTVGKTEWPKDSQGRPLYPAEPCDFEKLAEKLGRPLHPPGRDVRCIVSVGMLTEGWDCRTVTHVVGLRPFMSQLLCEQVVGRALRRFSYEPAGDGKLTEEVATVFGVPFQVIPFKAAGGGDGGGRPKRYRVQAVPAKAAFEIRYPRVEGYQQAIRNRVTVDWDSIAPVWLDPTNIPPEVQVKAVLPDNQGRSSLMGPGKLVDVTLNPYRKDRRLQQLAFELAADLTRSYCDQPSCEAPSHVLFPQLVQIAQRFLREKVKAVPPAERLDVFLSPYYGWAIEQLSSAIRPDAAAGEAPEVARYESHRGPGSTADVDFWTSKEVREVLHSHLNYAVADTKKWEESAAYMLDTHQLVDAFVKNQSLGFAIPYLHNGEMHDYVPDFIVRLKTDPPMHLILETKGFDPLGEVKRQAAARWVAAVNAEGSFGRWAYAVAKKPTEVGMLVEEAGGHKAGA
jgi:type III restriction enzyme